MWISGSTRVPKSNVVSVRSRVFDRGLKKAFGLSRSSSELFLILRRFWLPLEGFLRRATMPPEFQQRNSANSGSRQSVRLRVPFGMIVNFGAYERSVAFDEGFFGRKRRPR